MFAQQARTYILKLIHLQKQIRKHGYQREDQDVVNACRQKMIIILDYYKPKTDIKMMRLWITYRAEIRYLVPTSQYKGFDKLLRQFEELDRQSQVIELQEKITFKIH